MLHKPAKIYDPKLHNWYNVVHHSRVKFRSVKPTRAIDYVVNHFGPLAPRHLVE